MGSTLETHTYKEGARGNSMVLNRNGHKISSCRFVFQLNRCSAVPSPASQRPKEAGQGSQGTTSERARTGGGIAGNHLTLIRPNNKPAQTMICWFIPISNSKKKMGKMGCPSLSSACPGMPNKFHHEPWRCRRLPPHLLSDVPGQPQAIQDNQRSQQRKENVAYFLPSKEVFQMSINVELVERQHYYRGDEQGEWCTEWLPMRIRLTKMDLSLVTEQEILASPKCFG